MKLGVQGNIENASIKSYDALAAENQELKKKVAEAVLVILEQKNLLNQIGEDIKSGKLRTTEISPTRGDPVP